MRIIADQNIPLLRELLAEQVELVLVNGREISPSVVKDADALLVRSITSVDAQLLENSRVSFVGTATAGIDHVDSEWLETQNIRFASAAGANASAVADYVMAAFSSYMKAEQVAVADLKCGIIGVGHVGSEVARRLSAMGCKLRLCDPPRRGAGDPAAQEYVALEALADCDLVSIHVPLVTKGIHQTKQLIRAEFLRSLPPNAMIINSARGEVLDEEAAISVAKIRPDLKLVLDVFCHEPRVNQQLVEATMLATPHIAGYSGRAKSEAALRVAQALAAHFGLKLPADQQSVAVTESRNFPPAFDSKQSQQQKYSIWDLPAACFDIEAVSSAFKQAVAKSGGQSAFDFMRRDLAGRKEFSQLQLSVQANVKCAAQLRALGFTVEKNSG